MKWLAPMYYPGSGRAGAQIPSVSWSPCAQQTWGGGRRPAPGGEDREECPCSADAALSVPQPCLCWSGSEGCPGTVCCSGAQGIPRPVYYVGSCLRRGGEGRRGSGPKKSRWGCVVWLLPHSLGEKVPSLVCAGQLLVDGWQSLKPCQDPGRHPLFNSLEQIPGSQETFRWELSFFPLTHVHGKSWPWPADPRAALCLTVWLSSKWF